MARILIMTCGALLAALILMASQDARQIRGPAETKASQKTETAAPVLVVPPVPAPQEQDLGCERGQDDRKSDLCAQWKAADAAFDSAFWTKLTWFLGLLGAGIGAATLIAAWRAAHWAKAAAKHAEAGARSAAESVTEARGAVKAATDQIALARDAFMIENRPWVGIVKESVGDLVFKADGTASLKLKLRLRNTGKTPAHDVAVTAWITPENRAEDTAVNLERLFKGRGSIEPLEGTACIFPDQELPHEFGIQSLPETMIGLPVGMLGRHMVLTVWGMVTYRSESLANGGPDHATTFIYRAARSGDRQITWEGGDQTIKADQLQLRRWPQMWRAD